MSYMKLQTKLSITKQSDNSITYDSKVLLLGSCFAEHILNKFEYFKFDAIGNPFGVLFHPLAIENLITRAINHEYYTEADLCITSGIWYSYDAHSILRCSQKSELLLILNEKLEETHRYLKSLSHVIVSLGTAWVYRHIAADRLVANCHKLPQNQFLKELLSIDEISESIDSMVGLIKSVNPDAKVIFTVSPIRHLKDGFIENNRSKAHLLAAIHACVNPRLHTFYFPSYELVMDELRDYRFYKRDMIHPNDMAVDIIWDRFKNCWVSEADYEIMTSVSSIQKRLEHKAFNPQSKSHQDFLSKLNSDIELLTSKIDTIRF